MYEPLDIIQSIYDAINKANVSKLLSLADENIRIHLPASFGGDYYGREGLVHMVAAISENWESFQRIPMELFESANKTLVLGELIAKTKKAEQSLVISFVDIWKIKENTIEEAWFFYKDTAEMLNYFSGRL